ncbi:MAG: hypothetical protein A3H72_03130 [Candidatus Doudnabacteria bacterium RIFCSPLOWO2_02_FULL_48_8]|uniref:ZIP zinc transporter n=1 Tax=Candidatus Doudnabacteria bacterium RIFCSPHIGHO2_01_FULL_46_24 TaxID=1817825 RepID=A0A1F5NV82_9BACT|nr:MAG: hypothetical protein A2720_00560 [Candidatus Doudnabacteria bacterium RIFCSPHIGHO2_01_FULL_46_24]OGE95665.1 MAG: hypothetical protein A3H72_03130 [Candidatus Doudnabacteria bacterium RIFCSPLOWO2_02_FULL_48_8]OGE95965.1 MAG: hypothetical protein A3E98_04020 [Candidatus Doudnabacteria bacterium RIFCSPHIGHO2_12_FULL_48_11]
MTLILYGLLGGALSLIGGVLLLWQSAAIKKIMTLLLAFAAGSFLAVSFLDLIPEAVESVTEPHRVFIAVLVGFFVFFSLERLIMRHMHTNHRAENPLDHKEHTESLPWLIITGDSFHNFLDGVAIALAYVAEPALGLTATLAIAAHEVPQEIGDFSILLDLGWSKAKIITVNLLSSLLTLLGVLAGYLAAQSLEVALPYLLAGVAGIFLYIAASDLIPEIHHRAAHKHVYRILIPFVAGLLIMGYLVTVTH